MRAICWWQYLSLLHCMREIKWSYSLYFIVFQVWESWWRCCWIHSPCWATCCCFASLFSSSLGLWGSSYGPDSCVTAASFLKTSHCECDGLQTWVSRLSPYIRIGFVSNILYLRSFLNEQTGSWRHSSPKNAFVIYSTSCFPNLFDLFSSVKHKRWRFEECFSGSVSMQWKNFCLQIIVFVLQKKESHIAYVYTYTV